MARIEPIQCAVLVALATSNSPAAAHGGPEHDAIAHDLVGQAKALESEIEALPDVFPGRLHFDLDAEHRTVMDFFPGAMTPGHGIDIGMMSASGRRAAHDLLRTVLSHEGYLTVTSIMALENVLRANETWSSMRDPGDYAFHLFGTPSLDAPWSWKFEGHHVSLNFTIDGTQIRSTPVFLGANPAEVRTGPFAGLRVLAPLDDRAALFLASLTTAQHAKAVDMESLPAGILDRGGAPTPAKGRGLSAAAMTPSQRVLLLDLVRVYAGILRGELAESEMTRIRETGIERLQFQWRGPTGPNTRHYYRVEGPTVLIEFDRIAEEAGGPTNHVHAAWHDPERDYGADLLHEHYEAAHGGTHAASRPEDDASIESALARGVEILLERQEGDETAEWPYEGVYRVKRRIPIGYRVGGTALAVSALLRAPGYAEDPDRQAAVERAVRFICASRTHERMVFPVPEAVGYDVRGWGYACGLDALVELRRLDGLLDALGGELGEEIDAAIAFFLGGIAATEIPEHGGWNYARRGGFDQPGRPSPFMTGLTLQALLGAREGGHDVDGDMVRRGLDALEHGRTATGSYMYAGDTGDTSRESVPGSVGRMLVSETTLMQAGRGDITRLRGAIDAFLVHWEWLDKRRAQNGTHVAPYGIAPYYFYFAHYYAAQAIGLLPEHERAEYRRRVHDRIFSVRLEDGSWNDRVFDRSAAYGTSMIMRALAAGR